MARRTLSVLLRKELGELGRERIVLVGLLLGPFLIYLVLGGIAAVGARGIAKEAARQVSVDLVVRGGLDSNVSLLAEALNASGLRVKSVTTENPASAPPGADAVLVVDSRELAALLARGARINATVIINVKYPGILATQLEDRVVRGLETALRRLLASRASMCLPEASHETLESPANATVYYMYRGRLVPSSAFLASVMGAILLVPMAILIVVLSATQVASISLGIEKEARTLEKLLSMPLSFMDILLSKVLAIAVLSVGGLLSNVAGLLIYMRIISVATRSVAGVGGENLRLGVSAPLIGAVDAGLLFLGLAITLYVTILIGLIVGSASEDLRGSQLSASYVGFILSLPLLSIFFGLNPAVLSGTAKALLSADPYFILALLTAAALAGDRLLASLSLLGLLAHAVAWSLVARILLTQENILLGQPGLKALLRRLGKARRL